MSVLKKQLCCALTAAAILTSGLPSVFAEETQKGVPSKKPNIIYVMCDDLSAEVVSAFSGRYKDIAPTPNIDRLAKEGAVMNNTYCTNAICVPSRANIITGLPSQENGVYTLQDVLNPNLQTYPKLLHENGYATAMIGKWHLQSEPQGFDYYHIVVGQGQYGPSASTPNAKNVPYISSRNNPQWPEYIPPDPQTGEPYRYDNPNVEPYAPANSWPGGHVTESTRFLAMEWLENADGQQRDAEKPFMIMIHNKAPHVPNNGYALKYENYLKDVELPIPQTYDDDKSSRDIASKDFGMIRGQSLADYQEDIKGYLRLVKGIDDELGVILDYLDKPENKELKDNTVVVFTSDQGLFLGEHHYSDKRWILKESARMPMLVRYPAEIPAGTVCEDMVTSLDFAPTILDYAGVEQPKEMRGRSFRENLKGNTAPEWEQSAYFRYWANADANVPAHYGVRTKDFLLVMYYGMSLDMLVDLEHVNKRTPVGGELYDLRNDPNETTNVYYAPEYQDILKDMKALLKVRQAQAEGENYNEVRYPEMTARMEAFEAGLPDPEPENGVMYVLSNTDINTKTVYSDEVLRAKNKMNLQKAQAYTENLKKRATDGIISLTSAPKNQDGAEISKNNIQNTNTVCLDIYYDRITDKNVDADVYIGFYNESGQLIEVDKSVQTLHKGNNALTLTVQKQPGNDAADMKIFVWKDVVIPYTNAAGIDDVISGHEECVELPMDYRAKTNAGASVTLNQNGSGKLENWSNKTDTVTWKVDVPKAGKYVVSGKYAAYSNSNLVLTNAANGQNMETSLRAVTSMYDLNMGTIDLVPGINTLTVSRNPNGDSAGEGSVDLQDLKLLRVDSNAFAPVELDTLPVTLLLDQSIRFGNKLFHTGEKTFQWEAPNNGLMWKFKLNEEKSLKLKCEYVCGNKQKDPSFTIKIIDPETWKTVKEIPMLPMNRDTGTGFGSDWNTASNQDLAVIENLPAGEYILELGKVATDGTIVGTFVQNISFETQN